MLRRASMSSGSRWSLGVLFVASAMASAGCESGGGLLQVEGKGSGASGHTAMELVNGGTMAKSPKYQLLYVMGQPTPNQNVTTSAGKTLKGGLVGAVSSGDKK